MKLSWNSLRVSVAGAKLSHLVQKDKIWDHGTMVEQVKNVFYKIEKAKQNDMPESVKKYLGENAYEQLLHVMKISTDITVTKNASLTEVSIIDVHERSSKDPDRFTASLKGKRKVDVHPDALIAQGRHAIENFSERWLFVRHGDWWILAEMKK